MTYTRKTRPTYHLSSRSDTGTKAAIGCGCFAYVLYLILFVAFWALVAWAVFQVGSSFSEDEGAVALLTAALS